MCSSDLLGHAATIYSLVQGPPRVETPTVGTPSRGLLRVDEQLPVKLQMGSLQQPFQPGTVLCFGSLEFMSLDGSYDMILLPPPCNSDNGGRQLSHPALRNKARCISYMRQEDNIYNNRVYRDKCHNNQSIYYIAEVLQNKRMYICQKHGDSGRT